jgi:hypothetical protein
VLLPEISRVLSAGVCLSILSSSPLLLTVDPYLATQQSYSLHEVLLAGWGMPIGELFDLEKLAEYCKKEKRWSFFVTSEVCNVPGGVASPPNILAIF